MQSVSSSLCHISNVMLFFLHKSIVQIHFVNSFKWNLEKKSKNNNKWHSKCTIEKKRNMLNQENSMRCVNQFDGLEYSIDSIGRDIGIEIKSYACVCDCFFFYF